MLFPLAANSSTTIPEANLTIKKTPQNNEQAQTTTITLKKITTSPTTFFSDLLKQEQSIVQVINNTNNNSQPVLSIRGFGDNAFANSLIVVDGFPLTNPSFLAPLFNAIALSDIQQIDILQASEGSLWGDQAVGGVVKITTLHPEKPIANAIVSYGSYNRTFYNILLGDKLTNGFFFKLSGFANDTQNYRVHNHQSDQGGALQLGMDYATGSLTFNTKIYDSRIELPDALTQQQYDSDPQQNPNSKNFSHLKSYIYQLIHKQQLKDDWVLETRLAHNQIDGDGFFNSNFTREESQNTINPLLTGTLWNSKVLLGYQGQTNHFQLNTSMPQKSDTTQNDIYAQATIPFFTKWDFTLGGRSAWQNNSITKSGQAIASDNNNQVFVSEQTLTYHPTSEWDFFIRRDGNFRFAKGNEQTTLPLPAPPLLPQTGVSYEIGTKWHTSQQTTQLNIYRLELTHEIAFNPTQTTLAPFGSFSNLDPTLRQGVTLTHSHKLTDQLTVDGQFNYADARFASGINQNKQIPAVPAINGNIGLNYQFKPGWYLKYAALYTGSRYASQDVSNAGQKIPDYWLSTMALQYRLKRVNVDFSVENLFNQRYAMFTIYSPTTQTNTYYPGVGRNFLVTVKLFLD